MTKPLPHQPGLARLQKFVVEGAAAVLTIGTKRIIIDAEDVSRLTPYTLNVAVRTSGYAVVQLKNRGNWKTAARLARFLVGAAPGETVDHINGNTLDNRKQNLRILVEPGLNARNSAKYKRPTSSRFKGVSAVCNGKWAARIAYQGKRIVLGAFRNEVEAAHAYDEAAREFYGELGTFNFPKDGEQSAHRKEVT